MKHKKIKTAAGLVLALCCLPMTALALSPGDSVIPGGQVVGIRLDCDGVVVTSLARIETDDGAVSPAGEAGIRPGDRILSLNGSAVHSGKDFQTAAAALQGEEAELVVERGDSVFRATVQPQKSERDVWQLGLWLRDGVSGIGTVTFYDPESGLFGALGHGVEMPECGGLLPALHGEITRASVADVVPGEKGAPGELCGVPEPATVWGSLEKNTEAGIFGHAGRALSGREALPLAADAEIHPGPVTILSTVSGEEVQSYSAELVRIGSESGDARQLTLHITDPALLERTGGIVQGMSGSPLLQDGRLIGAVTHVLVSDPTKGYGISAENMLREIA